MKKINTYILEKLHLNKDIQIEFSIIDKYKKGDICLFINKFINNGAGIFIGIDAVKITNISEKRIFFEFLTNIYTEKKSMDYIDFNIKDNHKYILFEQNIIIKALLPTEDGIDLIEKLNGSVDKSIDIREIVYKDFKTENAGPNRHIGVAIVERASNTETIQRKRKLITNTSLQEIEDILKNHE